jgi:hypothetical protein
MRAGDGLTWRSSVHAGGDCGACVLFFVLFKEMSDQINEGVDLERLLKEDEIRSYPYLFLRFFGKDCTHEHDWGLFHAFACSEPVQTF